MPSGALKKRLLLLPRHRYHPRSMLSCAYGYAHDGIGQVFFSDFF